eukprot:15029299-Alexandrium_andersonii.AAC.1
MWGREAGHPGAGTRARTLAMPAVQGPQHGTDDPMHVRVRPPRGGQAHPRHRQHHASLRMGQRCAAYQPPH